MADSSLPPRPGAMFPPSLDEMRPTPARRDDSRLCYLCGHRVALSVLAWKIPQKKAPPVQVYGHGDCVRFLQVEMKMKPHLPEAHHAIPLALAGRVFDWRGRMDKSEGAYILEKYPGMENCLQEVYTSVMSTKKTATPGASALPGRARSQASLKKPPGSGYK